MYTQIEVNENSQNTQCPLKRPREAVEIGILLVSFHTEDMALLDCPSLPDQMDDQGFTQSCLKEQNLA